MTQEPTIDAKGLHLTFETNDGPVHALQDVNLEINKGDFVSFIGPSGCGKTTFLRCIAGLETPTSGHISVNGLTPDEARRARTAMYFRRRGFIRGVQLAATSAYPLRLWAFPNLKCHSGSNGSWNWST